MEYLVEATPVKERERTNLGNALIVSSVTEDREEVKEHHFLPSDVSSVRANE